MHCQNKTTTNNHIAQPNIGTLNSTRTNTTGVLIDVLGGLGGESSTDPVNDLASTGGGGGGGGGLGGLGLGLGDSIGSGVPEDNFNKYVYTIIRYLTFSVIAVNRLKTM